MVVNGKDRRERLDAVSRAVASARLEGLEPSGKLVGDFREWVDGEASIEALVEHRAAYWKAGRPAMGSVGGPDPYVVEGTCTLRNRLGVADPAELAVAENDVVSLRAAQLYARLPRATGLIGQLRNIHRQLFRDVYDWAGEVRRIDISKGGTMFHPVRMFPTAITYCEQSLRDDNLLRGLPYERFVLKLATHYDQVNSLHLFREGNGRSQRIFFDAIAHDAGYRIDWGQAGVRENMEASRAATLTGDTSLLAAMFRTIVRPLSEPAVDEPGLPIL
ncbi:Fic family protein [Bifidobacterium magnum]|uniref:protein adenylyltransferase n=1 Tax=Bifidobacterium magnum TaxID=1692 RepID=A0A087BA78_9BIFI|nr:Fic family protein [Bifidobacterium magnum]KFI67928.1 putative filamentation induced by cAMP protein Fic [Bifidobacterium magnum]